MSAWRQPEFDFLKDGDDYNHLRCREHELKEGSLVYLKPRLPNEDPEPALIRYCGPVPELGPGIFYGIEVLVLPGQGICDGSILGKRYFRCKDKAGSFVIASHLMPYRRANTDGGPLENEKSSKQQTTTLVLHLKKSGTTANRYTNEASSADLIDMGNSRENSPLLPNFSPPKHPPCPFSPPQHPPCPFSPPREVSPPIPSSPPKSNPLKLGDRVVWLSDSGPEYGTVRWLGVLPGHNASPHTMAGVEFDRPVGTGTGLYNRHQLFTTRKKHASFIPLLGLIRAEDFNIPEKPKTKPNSMMDHASVLLADEQYKSPPREERIGSPELDVTIDYNGYSVLINSLTLSPNSSSGSALMCPELRSPILPMSPVNNNEIYYPAPPTVLENSPPMQHVTPELGVGSVVEVMINGVPRYGVIRWVGVMPDDRRKKVAGIELEEDVVGGTDGTFHGKRYFRCAQHRGFFVGLANCHRDARFQDSIPNNVAGPSDLNDSVLTQPDCPVIPGFTKPLSTLEDLKAVCGKFRGIQGHHNSCYLDATLFSMFAFTSLLFRPATPEDGPHYNEVQCVLREEIVNPLRTSCYVRADRVMRLRTLLEKIGSVSGMTSEEKDPEEFLTSLLAQTLHVEPYLKLSSGQEAFMHQLFVEKDEQLELPSVQQLFEQSFLASDIKLREVPPCLILQMPRFGKAYKMYPRILPSQLLDITDVLESCPRQCIVCGKLAQFECKECFGQCGPGIESIAFCEPCLETVHNHQRRQAHAWQELTVPCDYLNMLNELGIIHKQGNYEEAVPPIPRIYMELFAVVCIETSHYVAFAKAGSGPDAPWVFFDSMADRKGEQNGYNIPEVSLCPELPHWLSEQGARGLPEVRDERQLPERAKRLLCDAYMCFYQSPDVAMYH